MKFHWRSSPRAFRPTYRPRRFPLITAGAVFFLYPIRVRQRGATCCHEHGAGTTNLQVAFRAAAVTHVHRLAAMSVGFAEMKLVHTPEIVAGAIGWLLSNQTELRRTVDAYLARFPTTGEKGE